MDEPSKPTIRVMRMKLSHKKQIKNNYEAQSLTKQVMENAKKKKKLILKIQPKKKTKINLHQP
jgi:hypothetical protein